MTRFAWAVLAAVGLAAVGVAADPPKPAVEVRMISPVDLAPYIEYGGELLGQGEAGKQFAGILKTLADNDKGFEGLDLKKPVGGYAVLADKVEDSTVVLMIPIADEEAFVGALSGKAGLDPKKDEKTGAYSVDVPNFPDTVHFRFADGYLYATLRTADGVDKAKLIAPKTFFAGKQAGVISAAVHFDRIPADLRKMLYGQLELQLKEGMQADADPTSKRLQEFLVDVGVDAVKTLLTEGETLTLSLDADPKGDDLKLALAVTPKKDTTLAKTLTSFADRDSVAAALAAVKNPVLSAGMNFTLPPEAKKKFAALADDLAKAAVDSAKESEKPVMKLLADAILPTLKEGDAQLGVVLTDAGKGKIGLTGGLKTVGGKDIEKTAKLMAVALPKEQGSFTPDADKAGERAVHKLTFAKTDGLPFASDTLWLLTSDDLIAVATDAKADGIKAVGTAKPTKAPMLAFEMSWVRFSGLVGSADADTIKNLVNSVFEDGKTDGLDTLKVTASGGKQFTLNVTLKGKAVTFLAGMNAK